MSFDLSHCCHNDFKSFKVFRRSQCFAKLFEAIIRNFGRCQAFDYKPMAQHKQSTKRYEGNISASFSSSGKTTAKFYGERQCLTL